MVFLAATALHAVTFANIWAGYPLFMVSLLAGLQGISRDFYEAADIDGAKAYQKLIFITIPQLDADHHQHLAARLHLDHAGLSIDLDNDGRRSDLTRPRSSAPTRISWRFRVYNLSQASASAVVILLISLGLTLLYIRYQKAR